MYFILRQESIYHSGTLYSRIVSDTRETLLLCLEMTARGFYFVNIDVEKSDAKKFIITEDGKGLIIPLRALDGLGENVADSIVKARRESIYHSGTLYSRIVSAKPFHVSGSLLGFPLRTNSIILKALDTMKIFTGPEVLGVDRYRLRGLTDKSGRKYCPTGTLGVPESV